MSAKAQVSAEALSVGYEVQQFIFQEASLLDHRKFEDWIALFASDGVYWAPSIWGQESPLEEVSLFYDDLATLKFRLGRLNHPNIHSQKPPSRTRHLYTNIVVSAARTEQVEVDSNFMMLEYRAKEPKVYGGSCRHVLQRSDDGFKIRMKRVDLINCDGVFSPLNVPF